MIKQGVVIDVDFGYNLKYKDPDNLFMKLEIMLFDDGQSVVQLFDVENAGRLLAQLNQHTKSAQTLLHEKVYLQQSEIDIMPSSVSVSFDYDWVENNNWD